jgi:ADP-ribose pyrophosphatase YjhB (NUDIX family)
MYKINIQESTLIISHINYPQVDWKIDHHINFPWDLIISQLEQLSHPLIYLVYTDEPEKAWKEFSEHYRLIVAAGGVVRNSKEEFLVIKRLGKYDLPKGKVEPNENLIQAALREVEEVCSIGGLAITHESDVFITYHTYKLGAERILKKTHWYSMQCTDTQKPKPQIEEGITDVKWIKKEDLRKIMKDSYPNIKLLIERI